MNKLARILTMVLVSSVLSLSPIIAETKITDDLKGLKEELVQKNPLIKELGYKIEAQKAKAIYAKAPSDPKLGIESRTNDFPLNLGGLGNEPMNMINLSLSKELKVLGKLSLREEIEEAELEKLLQEYNLTRLILASELKRNYYQVFLLDKSIEIYNKILTLLNSIEGSVKSSYVVGKGSQYDLIRIQLETTKIIEKLETLNKDREILATNINRLSIRPVNQNFNSEYLDISVNGLELSPLTETKILDLVKINYPELLAQEATIDKTLSMVKLMTKEYIPDLNLKGSYGFRNSSDFGPFFTIGLETSLPVFFNRKQKQQAREAQEQSNAEKQRYEDLEIETLANARKAHLEIEKSKVLTSLLKDALLPQANLAVESSVATYKVGETDFPSVLESINDLLKFEIEYYQELSKGLQGIAMLEPLVGKDFKELIDQNE